MKLTPFYYLLKPKIKYVLPFHLSAEGCILLVVAIGVNTVTAPIFTKDVKLQPVSKGTCPVFLLLGKLRSVLENGSEAVYRGEILTFNIHL